MDKIFLGIDVGTGSVRVGAFDSQGRKKGRANMPSKFGVQGQILWSNPRKIFGGPPAKLCAHVLIQVA